MVYFTEKVKESKIMDNRNKTCEVVFDIAKAFDKLWHNRLIFKLHKIGLPKKMGLWIMNFLQHRKFRVKVEDEVSDLFSIETSV